MKQPVAGEEQVPAEASSIYQQGTLTAKHIIEDGADSLKIL
jgi:hypothetical protein